MEFANLDHTVKDRVAEISMRREPVNAINHALIEDINNACRKAKADMIETDDAQEGLNALNEERPTNR